jgi:uncharacterized LabA/DUF88 family protein
MTMIIHVFIDNSNLFSDVKSNFGDMKLDYKKLKDYVEKVCRTNYRSDCVVIFNVYASERKIGDTPQSSFYKKLQYIGFNVKVFELYGNENGYTENGVVDIALAVDMAVGAARNFYDIAVLVAGDGGYTYLADIVKANGKVFDIIFPEDSLSDKLRRKAHYYTKIDNSVIDQIKLSQGVEPRAVDEKT